MCALGCIVQVLFDLLLDDAGHRFNRYLVRRSANARVRV